MEKLQKSPIYILLLLLSLTGCIKDRPNLPFLVSAQWLKTHVQDENIAILHVGRQALYDSVHIPGARYADYKSFRAPVVPGGLRTELPDSARLDSVLGAVGIDRNSRVVVYFGKEWVTPAMRICFTLKYAGIDDVHLLDGGMPAWQEAGYPLSTQSDSIKIKFNRIELHPEYVARLEQVKTVLQDANYFIIDARHKKFYTAESDGNGHIKRPGHIEGAVSIPYHTLLDSVTLKLKPRKELENIFKTAGYKQGQKIITYCHVGQQACLPYWAAWMLGYPAQLYDGSYDEWERDASLPIATGE